MPKKKTTEADLDKQIENLKKTFSDLAEGGQLAVGKKLSDALNWAAKTFPDAFGDESKPKSQAERMFGTEK